MCLCQGKKLSCTLMYPMSPPPNSHHVVSPLFSFLVLANEVIGWGDQQSLGNLTLLGHIPWVLSLLLSEFFLQDVFP